MEIRRKVFSLLRDENGEERYYSTNEFEISYDEETGEKMFSEKEDKKMSTGGKVAAGVGGAAVATVGALELANLIKKKRLTKKESKIIKTLLNDERGLLDKSGAKAMKKKFQGEHNGIKAVEDANNAVRGAYNTATVDAKIAKDKLKTAVEKTKEQIKDNKKTREWMKAEKDMYEGLAKEAEAKAKADAEAAAKKAAHDSVMENVPGKNKVRKLSNGKFATRDSIARKRSNA